MSHIGTVILWLFSALGAITAVVQIWKWLRGRRVERGFERFMESYADRDDAEAVRAELRRLEANLNELRKIVPSMARRMHLEQRRQEVAKTLGSTWDEYRALTSKLEEPNPTDGLPADLIDVLQADIQPRYRAEQKARRRTTFLLVLMAAALLLPAPFTPRSLLYLAVEALFVVAALPTGIGTFALFCGIIMTIIGLICGLAMGFWTVRVKRLAALRRPWVIGAITVGTIAIGGNVWSVFETLNALNFGTGGDYRPAIVINAIDCVIAATAGYFLIVAGLRLPFPPRPMVSGSATAIKNTVGPFSHLIQPLEGDEN